MLQSKTLQSPIAAYNNIIRDLSLDIERIYFGIKAAQQEKMFSDIIFDNKSITLFNFIKIVLHNNEICLRFYNNITGDKIPYIDTTIKNFNTIKEIFNKYLFVVDGVFQSFDASVYQKHVDDIAHKIESNCIRPTESFYVPHKNKVLDACVVDKSVHNVVDRTTVLVRFRVDNKMVFHYTLIAVLSSELDESKSLDNLRFEEFDVLKQGTVKMCNINQFLVDLFYYGNINY